MQQLSGQNELVVVSNGHNLLPNFIQLYIGTPFCPCTRYHLLASYSIPMVAQQVWFNSAQFTAQYEHGTSVSTTVPHIMWHGLVNHAEVSICTYVCDEYVCFSCIVFLFMNVNNPCRIWK